LYDSTRPYQLLFDQDFEQYVLSLPGSILRNRLHNAEDMTACKITSAQSGTARLLSHMVSELTDCPPSGGPSVDTSLADSLVSILVAALAENLGGLPLQDNTGSVRRDRIKAYVLENLRDPQLNIGKIAKRLDLTPSTVHRAWEGEANSLTSWIWSMRLQGAEQDLRQLAHQHRTITEIAYHWGFSSSAHFSRAFRRHFGVPPKEVRENMRALVQADSKPI
jgi:AraC-like DNA-binding protein